MMCIVILILLEDMGVMSELAVGQPLILYQSWLHSKLPSSSFISHFTYRHYSYPLPNVACSHTLPFLPLKFLTSYFRYANLLINCFYIQRRLSVVKDAFDLTEALD